MTSVARILIVDDDRSIRRTLEKFLGGEGHEVTTAQDAPGAIASAEGAELMLLDLGLPGGSGFDVLAALADHPRRPTVCVVTARDDMQSTVKAIQLGAYEYLVKPVDIDRLKEHNEARGRDRTLRRQGRVGTEEGLRVAQSGVQNILRELGVPDAPARSRAAPHASTCPSSSPRRRAVRSARSSARAR